MGTCRVKAAVNTSLSSSEQSGVGHEQFVDDIRGYGAVVVNNDIKRYICTVHDSREKLFRDDDQIQDFMRSKHVVAFLDAVYLYELDGFLHSF